MKKIVTIFSDSDGKSYFKEEYPIIESEQPLGLYSKEYPATGIIFRNFKAGAEYSWHTAPHPQYILYLEGEVEVEASGGESKRFYPGDILFANDLKGKGHVTRTLSNGYSVIVTAKGEQL
jgi:hypothetical protein